jgi:hypothetical protein
MPTLAGLRRRGVPPEAIRTFVRQIGVARADSLVDVAMLDHAIRDVLNKTAPRRMAVLRPLKVVIENYPEGQVEELEAVNNPEDPAAGSRRIRFGREIFIERDDFMENPPKKFFRLAPGQEVRLRYAYFVRCREAVKNASGEVVELRCTYDPETRGGNTPPDGRKVKATLHWVARLTPCRPKSAWSTSYFGIPRPDPANLAEALNPDSLEVLTGALVEPAAIAANTDVPLQFERQGYFRRERGLSVREARFCSYRWIAGYVFRGHSRRRSAATSFQPPTRGEPALKMLGPCRPARNGPVRYKTDDTASRDSDDVRDCQQRRPHRRRGVLWSEPRKRMELIDPAVRRPAALSFTLHSCERFPGCRPRFSTALSGSSESGPASNGSRSPSAPAP